MDLAKILSVAGKPGLHELVAQSKTVLSYSLWQIRRDSRLAPQQMLAH